ncbi:MAG TPA: BamA/TamA family outer membrane protein, partial [Candidatus Polarisedimenticolia bacterium]|nr:BamA/TamA family outer membrane protein [Candidatus Polarisedimenticolia bacterium]
TSIETRGPRDEDTPPLAQVFAASLPESYGERSAGVLTNALLRLDTTRNPGRPEPGCVAEGQVTYFGPTRDEVAFWRYVGQAGAFVPLFFTDRTLALRGAVTWTGPTGSDVVPFTRLATNHSGESLRGYRDYRWRDRGLIDLTAEYRWPAWALDRPHGIGVDAFLFLDTGQVFGDWAGIKTRLWRTSFGGGFRAVTSRGFGGRLEIARSRESTQIRLQADQMFDFKDIGLYGGNYHVAAPN